ncbi:ribosome small subunit-dependent GTPase A [Lysinibacillus sp. 2017]|uniref:ribosome small subunit-dependent GTPase A n=1 Tax=unclassified Lysinibacillus TaxID=2636778 RepID=UPI000D529AA7|nr:MULTISPECIES: ribosome small subunit-dependent GTPase A [unclassified Lysinibacillus]AWE07420.1 ribosome small subunit-dependent GTPase A [Lysinibacillus sp. 2017]TGN36584.1 ribosome small subunit-dependent GTPase A [Lysinibacillus sp. S2017]
MNLQTLGFNTYFETQLNELTINTTNKIPARVILEHKHSYRVITEQGEWLASISGNFAFNSYSRKDYPAVGDFVLVEQMPGEERAIIHHLFERKSKFTRKMAGQEMDEQIVASNVDIVFLAMSLNADFNVRRLERYLIAAWDSGAKPVIVLTKADLCDDVDAYVQEVESIAFGVEIIVVSAVTGEGVEVLREMLSEGMTAALLGSSGAGKSTLTNALVENEQMKVSGIREEDAKGRHTTTHRELVLLPTGASLIDTPGMRELQLWDQGDSLSASFSDIEELAENCRFRDCTHKKEPHCAIRTAIDEGTIEEARLRSYFKLQKELAYIEKKANTDALLAEKRKFKQSSKSSKK